MVDFGGWDMPVQYSGIIDEHQAVRTAVGLFDVSHMGEIEIRGPEAGQLTDFVTTNLARKLKTGQAHYSGLLYEHGGFVDDILVHKVAGDHERAGGVRRRLLPHRHRPNRRHSGRVEGSAGGYGVRAGARTAG
jgi:glycine cleavage system aminomethyltransferase T